MSDIGFTVTIDGRQYPEADLRRYEYLRVIHMLHEFKRLGVDIRDDAGTRLSHEDINWLAPDDAKRISIATRAMLGPDAIKELFAQISENTAARWRRFNEIPIEQQGVRLARTEFAFRGLVFNPDLSWSLPGDTGGRKTRSLMGRDPRGAIEDFPEHYAPGMETVGMYGEPIIAKPAGGREIPPYVPLTPDPDYPIWGAAVLRLAGDDFDTHLGVVHEYQPGKTGYRQRSTLFYPNSVPEVFGEGHKIHFAIEMINDFQLAHQRLTSG